MADEAKIEQAGRELDKARIAYEAAAANFLAAVEATDNEKEAAIEEIYALHSDDPAEPNDALDWDVNVAEQILAMREEQADGEGQPVMGIPLP